MNYLSYNSYSARLSLMKNFTLHHRLSVQHVDRQIAIDRYKTSIASELSTRTLKQLCTFMNETSHYIQKSNNNEMRRRTYSLLKHRHFVKSMIKASGVSFLLIAY